MAFAQLIAALDYNIVYVALPDIGRELGFSAQTLQWVVSAYALAFGGFLLLGGRAADLLGRRNMFVLALVLYGGGSLIGGLATSPGLLVAARAIQGLGGALLVPATLSLISTNFQEGPERTRALAIWGGAGAGGLALGSLLGGVLTNWFGWESVFYVNVPLAAIVIIGAYAFLPAGGRVTGRSFDIPGAVIATAGVSAVVFGLVQGPEIGWGSPYTIATLAGGAVLLAVFLAMQARTADPLLPLSLFRNRSHATAVAITFIFMGTFGSQYYFFTVYLQDVLKFDALETGLGFLPLAVLNVVGTKAGEKMVGRSGARGTMITGLLLGTVGMVLFALLMSSDGSYAPLLAAIVFLSIGQGITWTGMWVAASTGVAPEQQGVASATASTSQQIGSAVGLAVLVAIAAPASRSGTADFVGGLQTAVYVSAALTLIGVLIAFALPSPKASAPASPELPPQPQKTATDSTMG
ncbi:MFS transporter [Streptomyces uncialis]|uniref:MFS transporter n=1 Tax=Streptomyces uncialis TaxID=1048205 RepID=UPI00340B7E23